MNIFKLIFCDILFIIKKIYRYYYWNLKKISVDYSCSISIKAKIEPNCFFTGNTQITDQAEIGEYTYGHNVTIHHAKIGKYCSIGPDVKIGLDEHPLDKTSTHPKFYDAIAQKKAIINDHVWIGANCVILGGVTIGEHAVIAAGAVVSKNVDAYTIVGGVPAVFIKNRNK
mgnify:FL=1